MKKNIVYYKNMSKTNDTKTNDPITNDQTFNSSGNYSTDYSITTTTLQEVSNNFQYQTVNGVKGGSKISNVPCFNKGTKILCLNTDINTGIEDIYICIEDITTNDYVKTFKDGYKKVNKIHKGSFINNPNKPFLCMYKMNKKHVMIDDLIVTGKHSIIVDKLTNDEKRKIIKYKGDPNIKIDDKYLILACVSDKFEQIKDNEKYEYYHLSLNSDNKERRYGIWANGVLTETTYSENIQELE